MPARGSSHPREDLEDGMPAPAPQGKEQQLPEPRCPGAPAPQVTARRRGRGAAVEPDVQQVGCWYRRHREDADTVRVPGYQGLYGRQHVR